ncbi:MAG: glycerophosphoryl diester phosphodiesterase membrane domain-containing protein [Sphingomonadales bacterium]|nr:glycerophosphoryl diester phosphodiesterase membrane domain-containing protein [Sphingomonadales bacterium]
MKFDSNQAWKDASSAVSANRDLLSALGGVFLALPTFALSLFMPPPEPPTGADAETVMALLGQYYTKGWPALIAVALLSLLGTLTMLTLFTDRSRPTVGEAIRQGARAVLPVIAAQILTGIAIATLMVIVMSGAGISGSTGLKMLAVLLLVGGLSYVFIRISLLTPVVVVEGQRNPVAALKRSWDLTQGNVLHLLAFYVLLMVAFVVIYLIVAKGLGLVIALVTSGSAAAMINDLIAACLQAALSIYSVAVVAACHRQLAGPSSGALAERFD